MSDITLAPIPQESENNMRSWQEHQGEAGEVVLEPSVTDQEQSRAKENEGRWQDVSAELLHKAVLFSSSYLEEGGTSGECARALCV